MHPTAYHASLWACYLFALVEQYLTFRELSFRLPRRPSIHLCNRQVTFAAQASDQLLPGSRLQTLRLANRQDQNGDRIRHIAYYRSFPEPFQIVVSKTLSWYVEAS
jgi:hypothetical protein